MALTTALKSPLSPFPLLLKTAEKEPEELGYEFGRWTAKRLATYLEEITGIKLSSSQVTRILEKKSTFIFGQNIV